MQVKKFEAPTIQEALEAVKKELGPEAIILQTKKHKKGFGFLAKSVVQVTAAVSERSLHKIKITDDRLPEKTRSAVKKLPAQKQAEIYDKNLQKHLKKATAVREMVTLGKPAKPVTATRYIDIDDSDRPLNPETILASGSLPSSVSSEKLKLETELKEIRGILEELRNSQKMIQIRPEKMPVSEMTPASDNQILQEIFEELVVNGVDKKYSLALIREVVNEIGMSRIADRELVEDELAQQIMNSVEIGKSPTQFENARNNGGGPQVLALIGPTGSGKTTTAAKIAAEAVIQKKLQVGLINYDGAKISGFEQLASYARIFNLPFRSAQSEADLDAALKDFQSLDLAIIDTMGRPQREMSSLNQDFNVLKKIPKLITYLTLSVITRDQELYEMFSRYSHFRPQGLILSRIDEASLYGSIFNIAQKSKQPLVYFTTGQRVPEDIEFASRERVAALILDIE